MGDRRPSSPTGSGEAGNARSWQRDRPENFSTYVPRDLVRRLKIIAALRDVPLWAVVTDSLEQYLERFEDAHGRLPDLARTTTRDTVRKG